MWIVLKYGVGLSLLGIVPTVIVFWLWILWQGCRISQRGGGTRNCLKRTGRAARWRVVVPSRAALLGVPVPN